MIDLKNELVGFTIEEQREVSYYLVRYFKGSPYLEEDGKDIFQEVFDQPVEPYIRQAVEGIIEAIEAKVGSAMEYDEETADRVLNFITEFEDSITERPTDSQISDAETFFRDTKDFPS
ncbi:hypothetical protein SAMN05421763_1301 [[Luteovulum] sphaeroides subsp. megalophilum]|uniref:hypothetical protein n=1 Tax=Cereibacter sphaeroides TaxID=1063 RepID=UPI000B6B67D5|nr:hypothetical protein [Cereibacter sphaeroides]SNT44467.1 hypothetical protein SAMN05421763_1301 [[Luteovulum] sphaeroides subsp. megalophilum]